MTIGDGIAALAGAIGFTAFCATLVVLSRPLTLMGLIAVWRGRSFEIEPENEVKK